MRHVSFYNLNNGHRERMNRLVHAEGSERLSPVLTRSVDIACNADRAWAYIRDMGNYVDWFPGIVAMDSVEPGAAIGVNARYSETALLPGGKESAIDVAIIAFDEIRRHLAITASLDPVMPRFDYYIDALGSDICRLRWICRGRARGPYAALGRQVMRAVLSSRSRLAMANFKRIVENRPGTVMRAARTLRFGPPERSVRIFAGAARPQLKGDEVLVSQAASSVNRIDCLRAEGYGRKVMRLRGALNFPITLGNDISGRIVAIGSDVTQLTVGDAVFGVKPPSSEGAFADIVAVKAAHVRRKPDGLSFEDAAALPYAFLTAWSALCRDGGLGAEPTSAMQQPRVFIQGGAGAVGSMAVQIARHFGAYVEASCSARDMARVLTLGAHAVVDYRDPSPSTKLASFDIVMCAANDDQQDQLLSLLRINGAARYVTVVHPTLPLTDEYGVIAGMLRGKQQLRALNRRLKQAGQHAYWSLFAPAKRGLDLMAEMAKSEGLRPLIDEIRPLLQLPRAMALVSGGSAGGKIVITMSEDQSMREEAQKL